MRQAHLESKTGDENENDRVMEKLNRMETGETAKKLGWRKEREIQRRNWKVRKRWKEGRKTIGPVSMLSRKMCDTGGPRCRSWQQRKTGVGTKFDHLARVSSQGRGDEASV